MSDTTKLPKWAQALLADITRERDEAQKRAGFLESAVAQWGRAKQAINSCHDCCLNGGHEPPCESHGLDEAEAILTRLAVFLIPSVM